MIFGLPFIAGAGLIGTAAFGIAKLAGASTKTALLAGLGTFAGMSAFGALSGTAGASTIAGKTTSAGLAGGSGAAGELVAAGTSMGKGAASITPALAKQIGYTGALTGTGGAAGTAAITPALAESIGYTGALANTGTATATAASPGLLSQAGDMIGNLSTAEKIGLGVGAANLMGNMNQPQQPPLSQQMPYSEEDYATAKARADAQVEGMAGRADYSFEQPRTQSVYEPINPIYANEGGLISLAHFSEGGVNYLPSKMDHDEQDSNNYVRATGYVEDGSGNGDKDEDTMLAQLADGEFVSRADAILGAGIMSGANPDDFKEMRRKGASFFYKQQDQLKRIYDIVNNDNKTS